VSLRTVQPWILAENIVENVVIDCSMIYHELNVAFLIDFGEALASFHPRLVRKVVGYIVGNIVRIDKGILVVLAPIFIQIIRRLHHERHEINLTFLTARHIGTLAGLSHLDMHFLGHPLGVQPPLDGSSEIFTDGFVIVSHVRHGNGFHTFTVTSCLADNE
jgi:hypothetical protein